MKRLFYALIIVLLLASCSDTKTFTKEDGTKITAVPYGLINPEDKVEGVIYKAHLGDVILGIVLVETVIAPIYIFGWDVMEPVALETE